MVGPSRAFAHLALAIAGLFASDAAAQDPAPDPRRPTGRLVWRGPAPFDPRVAVPPVPAALDADRDCGLWLVQGDRAPDDRLRAAIEAAGGRRFWYVPEHAYAVRIDAAGAARLAAAAPVRWVGRYAPAWRLEPELQAVALRGGPGTLALVVLLVDRDRDPPRLRAAVEALGGTVRLGDPARSTLAEVDLPAAALAALARRDEVIWIERRSAVELDMDNARVQGGADHVERVGGYTGRGVLGHVHEGVEAAHPDFRIAPQPLLSQARAEAHGHATAGIVFGNGTSNPRVRGMAPDATFRFTDYNSQTTPWTMRGPVFAALASAGVMFTTASWGQARTTFYTAISAEADQALFDHRLPWTQSQSNAGNQLSRPQAWAKNVFAVGGVHHADNATASDDSWRRGGASTGPAVDGRIKPDFCAYYDSIGTSDLRGSAGYSSADWSSSFGGTSGATPIVAGHNALAIQMFTDGLFGNPLRVPGGTRFQNRPRATTLKALLIATARQYAFDARSADNRREHQGWGFPDLRAMHDDRDLFRIVDESDAIVAGQTRRYPIQVAAGRSVLKVALAWADPPGLPNAPSGASVLVNDLDLRVVDPAGRVFLGNAGLRSGTASTTGGSPDRVDSVECVFVDAPPAGVWTVEVTAVRIAQDGRPGSVGIDADFGLVVRGGVDPGPGGGGNCRTVFSDDADPGGSAPCGVVPFGSTAGTAVANQKFQTLVPAARLGGAPGAISALAFAACGSGPRRHDRILVRMSHVPPGHVLAADFAANVPNPVTLLAATDWVWDSAAGQWARIGLMTPFAYDGGSDLVVEIEVEGSDFAGVAPGFRSGAGPRVSAFGWSGAPPATGSVAAGGAPKLRLEFDCASVNRLGRPCSTFEMTWQGPPRLGGTFDVGVRAARPNRSVFLNFGYDNRPPGYPVDLGALGLPGCTIWHDALAVLRTPTGATGDGAITVQIPNLPAIAGGSMFVQAVALDSAFPGGGATSDYLRCVFGN